MNAATNPFRSECVTTLPFMPQGHCWEELWGRLEALSFRGAVVGPCGSGKTTLLEAIMPQLGQLGFQVHFHRLDTQTRHLPGFFWKQEFQLADAVLLDGAEQLSKWHWQRFKRKAKGAGALVISSHRPGLLPLWCRAQTSPKLLALLCQQLGYPLAETEAEAIYRLHNGNLRECLLQLYDGMGSFP